MKRTIEVYNTETEEVYYWKTFKGSPEYIEEIENIFFNLEYRGCLNAHDYNTTPLKVRYNDTKNN